MKKIEFRIAEKKDLKEIFEIFSAAIKEMNKLNILQWDEVYPDKDILETEPDVKYKVNNDALPRYTDENGKVKGFRDGEQKSNCLTASMHKGFGNDGCTVVRATVQANAEHTYNGKVPTITASMGVGGGNVPLLTDYETAAKYKGKYIDKYERLEYRKLTPLECERLQTFPDNWTDCISNTQRYKSLGNAWTVGVIVHILKCMLKEKE